MFTALEAQAQNNIQSLILDFGGLLNSVIVLLSALALLIFLWGLAKYIFRSGDESRLEDAKRFMFWGIISLFVLFSIWGIVQFLQVTFGVRQGPYLEGVDNPDQIENPFSDIVNT